MAVQLVESMSGRWPPETNSGLDDPHLGGQLTNRSAHPTKSPAQGHTARRASNVR
ncbi:MAG TPA: hypothetical protein VGM60_12110 [Pseudonocardia sp.]